MLIVRLGGQLNGAFAGPSSLELGNALGPRTRRLRRLLASPALDETSMFFPLNSRCVTLSLLGTLVLGGGTTAWADIVQGSGSGAIALTASARFGQSFTATANEPRASTVSFMWGSYDPWNPDPTMTVTLRSGAGFGGPALGTQTVGPILDTTPDMSWVNFTFAMPIPLTAGQTYTLDFTKANTLHSGAFRIQFASPSGPYAGGTAYYSGAAQAPVDLAFRVISAVPEASGLLMGLVAACGGGALAIGRRLRCG
jgi:hypothetical protein